MRILICAGIFPPDPGGPATYSSALAKELADRGHEIRVISYSKNQKSSATADKNQKYGISLISRSRFKLWHYFKYFLAVLKHGREYDILYAQDPVSAGYPTYLANKFLGKLFVLKITGDYSWEQAANRGLTSKLIDDFQNLKEFSSRIKKIREIQIKVCQAANLIVTPSEYLKKIVIGWGVEVNKIRVIYNAVRRLMTYSKAEARKDLSIKPDEFVVLSVGRNVPWKGFELLQKVADELSLKLVILHEASRETVEKYFSAADLFVLNSGYEGFSHSVLEAIAAGLPVITTNVGGNPEVIRDGENGILVEYNNKAQLETAIRKLYNNPQLRQEFIQNSRETLKKFSFEKLIESTEAALKSFTF